MVSEPKRGMISSMVRYEANSMREESKFVAHNLIMKFSVSMALKAVLELGIPDILAYSDAQRPLSAREILAQLPTKSTPGAKSQSHLKRLFTPLVREGFFSESLNSEQQAVYGLTEVSKWFLRDNESNLTSVADLQLHPVTLNGWDRLHELILDETAVPFVKAHGIPLFEYGNTEDTEFGALLQDGMVSYFHFQKDDIMDDLRRSGVLNGVKTLVDVGGGWGSTITEIVARNPHIQGINFDLRNVIATAPMAKGVRHVAGNYLEALPSGDAMFLKIILHDHGDDEAIQILRTCYKALPPTGKVVIAEYIVKKKEDNAVAIFKENVDLLLLAHAKGAGERTEEQYLHLLAAAGFRRSNLFLHPDSYDFIEAFKE